MEMMLRGASVVDGTGAPARRADVLVSGDRIGAVVEPGRRAPQGTDEVDLTGLVLAPGFVDPHTHYDAQVLWDPSITPSSWNGITTVVMGNCGFGIAPARPEGRTTIMRVLENVEGMPYDALDAGIPWSFESFPEYLDVLDRLPLRINVAALVGHTPVRYYVMGDDATERAASPDEVRSMRAIVDGALEAGAVGFSTSRSTSHIGAYGRPVPSRAADLDEIRELARALGAAGHGTFEATWGPDLFVDEFAQIATDIGRPITWAAIMSTTRDPDYAPSVVARTAAHGGSVFPQIACRPLVVEISLAEPAPFASVAAFGEILARPQAERAALYADPAWVQRAAMEMREQWGAVLDSAVVAVSAAHPALVEGEAMGKLAGERGIESLALMVELALADQLSTRFRVAMTNDNEAQIGTLLADHRLLLGLSDAGAHTSQLCDANFATYLLGYWCRQRQALSLEDAVWRVTGHPSQVYGLHDRGVIRDGAMADLVAFDADTIGSSRPERLRDFPAGAERLVVRGEGIEHVWVAGTPIEVTGDPGAGAAPGRLLRHGR